MSNNLISKSVQKRLAVQQGDDFLTESVKNFTEIIEGLNKRHEEDMGYIQHYRIRIAELEKALKDNNIEVP